MDAEIEEEEMEIPYMEPEGNVEILGVDMEGQESPPKVVEIDDPNIPQDPSLITPDIPAEPDGSIKVLTLSIEGPCRFKRVRSQPDTYSPSMTGKIYEYSMT